MRAKDHYLKKELYDLIKTDSSIFDFLQNGSLDGVWYWDLENQENEWMSPRFWTVLGYDPEEKTHLASEWQDLIHPEDLKIAINNFTRHLEDPDHPYDQVVRYLHKNGATVWVRCRGMAIRDEDGKPLRMLGVHTDLTQQKRTEEALTGRAEELDRLVRERTRDLSRSKELLQKVFAGHPEAIFVLDNAVPPLITDCNPAAEMLFGYRRDALTGHPMDFLHTDPARLEAYNRRLREQIRETGAMRLKEFELKHRSGELIPVEISVTQLLDNINARMGWICAVRDIREQKKYEAAIRQSEENFRTVADFTYDWEVWRGPDGAFIYVSPSCERITGWPREAFLKNNKLAMDIVHPEDKAIVNHHFKDQHDDKNVHKLDFRIIARNGEIRWISHYCQPVFDARGEWRGRRASNRDITDRKRNEEKLVESEGRFRELFNNMSSGVAIYDSPDDGQSFVFKELNRAGLEFGNKKKDQVIGREIREVFPGIEEMGLFDVFKRVWKTGTAEHHPVSVYQDEIVEQWVENYICKLPSGELVMIYEDVTARKKAEEALEKSEERLNLALESVSDAVWDWRVKTGDIYFSPRWYTMLGYAPYEMPQTYGTWQSLLHPDDLPHAQQTVQRHLGLAEPFEIEFRLRTRDNQWKWILGRGKTVEKDDMGNAVRMLGTHVDITERKKIETRLQQAQKMESIGALAGGIAHDFNNLLNPIIGFSEIILEDEGRDPAQTAEFVRMIQEAGMRAKDLVKQILAFSRSRDVELAPCNLSAIAKEAVKFLRSSMPVTIEFDVYIAENLIAMADPTQFHQVIVNLFTNAGHAMADNGGALSVRLIETELSEQDLGRHFGLRPGRHALLSVSDTGPGIPHDIMNRIFDPFFTTKGEKEGTGLGLSVAHGIVKSLNGDISVESSPGGGAAFHVYLPLVKAAHDEKVRKKAELPGGTERILFVDDEPMAAAITRSVLQRLGYQVAETTNGIDALNLFRQDPDAFDLVISDMTMPKMTGYDMILEIRKIRPDIPAVICTGYSDKMDEDRARKAGIDAFLDKPIDRASFAKTVRQVLDGAI